MRHIFDYILLSVLLAAVMSCSDNSAAADDITTAEQAVEAKDYDLAQSICETFVTDSTSSLGVNELCRLSMVYMSLSDVDDVDNNTASALQCMHSAMKLNADSALAFYNNTPVEQARYVQILLQLEQMIDNPDTVYGDSIDYEEAGVIGTDNIEIEP
ncbi:MAG: hypothetical protein K2N28_01275 [Muribaculaceae bacterium]|nr:hypothetical protein [Muribaculaceae bacterium]